MGMISVILLRNDTLNKIREMPCDFAVNLIGSINGIPSIDYLKATGVGEVITVDHISGHSFIEIDGGHGKPLPFDEQQALERYRKRRDGKLTRRTA